MGRKKKQEATLVVQLREAIQASGRSLWDIGRAADIQPSQLSRFLRGERDLTLGTAARLFEVLDLELVPRKKPRKPQRPGK